MRPLSRASIVRVTASLIAAERANHGTGRAWDSAAWTEATSFNADGLALDSLELWACSSEVSRFFRLHETGKDNRLFNSTTLGGWCDIIESALTRSAEAVTFATSGTTGLPKLCCQKMDVLRSEARYWGQRFNGRRRVIQTVAAHHIYGFLFAILLPELTGWPVCDARLLSPDALRAELAPSDLLVGFPTQLSLLQRAVPDLPGGLGVVSATSELDSASHAALYALGAAEVVDIYGSTETAGIAERQEPGASFRLLPRWRRASSGDAIVEVAGGALHRLPDHVRWAGEDAFHVVGRVDGGVQVAGVNVYPTRVAAVLRAHSMVADAAVWLDTTLPEPRLRAFLVPARDADEAALIASCEAWARRRLTAPERPVSFRTGPALPNP